MAAGGNLIQIKRSLTTANATSLANGELAFTANGDVLWIGSNGGIQAIGGKRTPGTLTANQALVANATSGIDKVIVANLVSTYITANGVVSPGAGYYLAADTNGNTYWAAPGTLSINAAAQYAWTNTHSFANVVTFNGGIVANSGITANGSVGTAGQVLASNGTSVYWVTPTAADITEVTAGAGLTGGGTSGAVTLDIGAGNGITVTADAIAVDGANGISVTADGVNVLAGSDGGLVSNATGVFITAGAGLVTNSTGLHVGAANGITVSADAIAVNAGSTLTVNTTGVHVNTANLTIATSQLSGDVALGTNTSGNYVATITAGNGISGSSSTEGGAATIAVVANNGIVSNTSGVFAAAANGISVDAAGINVVGGSGLVANSTGVHVGAANGISVTADAVGLTTGSTLTVNSTGAHVNTDLSITSLTTSGDVTVNGNTTIGNATSDIVTITAGVASNINPSANVTYSLGTNTMRFNEIHAANVHSVSGYFDGDVQISGNLSILGDLLTINVATLAVEDSLIQLAKNNTSADLLDIGLYGNYNGDGGAHEHTGIFRDATDGIYKLFQGLSEGPTTTVNTAAAGYSTATLQAYLSSGALTSNSSAVTITANSTVAVNITANTLTLATALAATSGGTGLNSYTSGDLLVANTGNTLSKLGLGTSGYVLQSNGTALVYDTLDGGTF